MATSHRWRFFRAGGFDQVRLDTGADLLSLGALDQKLWVALACPTATIHVDARTLSLLDTDGDKRVRASELIEGCRWAGTQLSNPDDLVKGRDGLAVSAISATAPDGPRLREAALRVLTALGKDAGAEVTVAEATDAVKALHASPINGDGVIVEKTASDEALRQVIREIVTCLGGEPDRSGTLGIGRAAIDRFFVEVASHLAWHDEGAANPATSPLPDTAAARALLTALQPKVADYFTRCRLAGFDPRAGAAMNREDKDYLALSAIELSLAAKEIAAFPLARVEPARPLPLRAGLNPAWEAQVHAFAERVVAPLLGAREAVTEQEWAEIQARFAPFDAWQAKKQGTAVAALGIARLRELAKGEARAALHRLVDEDLAIEPVSRAVADLEKLVRFHRDLHRVATNFVSFRDFYARKDRATFQAGTLYIDQRSCDLCIRVEDAGKHATLAPLARTYLAYCDCHRDGKKMAIVAAFTAGDSDNLMVGRNGVFYDREGNGWDATITKIVDNPISVGQAFWAPYKKVVRFIEDQFAKRAAAADTNANERLTGTANELGSAASTGAVPEQKPKFDIGMIAALGVAVGGLTAALGAMMQAFFGLGLWMPLGLLALLLAISGPSMAVAWLKLRQRNLAPLLDANGWAMNSPARINIPFGRSLTQVAVLPPGAARDLRDPYAERRSPAPLYVAAFAVLLLALTWASGKADGWLPERARRTHFFQAAGAPTPTPLQAEAPVPAPKPKAPPSTAVSQQTP